MKNTKYEYRIIDKEYGYVTEVVHTRDQARAALAVFKEECPKQKFAIIQRKFECVHTKEIR